MSKAAVTRSLAAGFTLIELMVTIVILAILLAIVMPSFNNALLGGKLNALANNFIASTNLARSEAIKRNSEITLCMSANGTSCASTGSWEQGWIVACKTTNNTLCDTSGSSWIVFQHQQANTSGLKIVETTSGSGSFIFQSTGVGAIPGRLKICRATPTTGLQERVVSVSASGRVSVEKTALNACP
ncbi:MAG: GspH/FimT family pseudopilin [Pseudomonadota bacterium]